MKVREKRQNETGRRETDKLVAEQKLFLQSVVDGVTEPILVIGTDYRLRLINQAAQIFAAKGERRGEGELPCHELVFGYDSPCGTRGHRCPLIDVIERGQAVTVEHVHRESDGTQRVYEILASPLWAENGDLLGITELFRDVTARKEMTDSLQKGRDDLEEMVKERASALLQVNAALRREVHERRRLEEEFRRAKEHAEHMCKVIPSAIFTVDLNRRITSWNNKAESLTGFTREEIIGKECRIFSDKPCSEKCGLYAEDIVKPVVDTECSIRTKDNRLLVIKKNVDLLRGPDGSVIGGIECFDDITGRKSVENELRTERDKFMSMLAAMKRGMHIVNQDYCIEYQNEVLRDLFGDKIGERCFEVYKGKDTPCEVCRMHEAVSSGVIQRTEEIMSNGRYYEQAYAPFTDVDGATKTLILLRDITEERAHQAETLRAGQLASIGELAAGVAHEINNPINGIINYAQILLDEARAEDGEAGDILVRIISEGERIAQIVSNLLSFARQSGDTREEVSISDVVEDAIALLRHQFLKDGIEIAFKDSAVGLPAVWANRQQLQQVFLNLLSNARYALNKKFAGRNPHKRVVINSKEIRFKKKRYVRTSITDHGCGIPHEAIKHVFEPFYTLKAPGEGTGLGLSISHGLILDFNGFLRVESEFGSYTTLTVDLPVAGKT